MQEVELSQFPSVLFTGFSNYKSKPKAYKDNYLVILRNEDINRSLYFLEKNYSDFSSTMYDLLYLNNNCLAKLCISDRWSNTTCSSYISMKLQELQDRELDIFNCSTTYYLEYLAKISRTFNV